MSKVYFMLNGKKPTTKNLVKAVLVKKFPLSLKQIYLRVKSKSLKPVSYQAVHKTIKGLKQDGCVILNDKKYQINPEWVKKGKRYFELIEKALFNNK